MPLWKKQLASILAPFLTFDMMSCGSIAAIEDKGRVLDS
jgi:hypothetical protein